MDDNTKQHLYALIQAHKEALNYEDEAMDGDAVEVLVALIRQEVNIHEGNV